jgi:hypothetical protein
VDDKWYSYTMQWNGRDRTVVRPMGAAQAERLGAEPVPDFDPAQRVAGVLVCSFAPDGDLEQGQPMTAEAPAGRFA